MDISNDILSIIQDLLLKKVALDEELLTSGLIDSISAMELVDILESNYSVNIPLEQLVEILATPKSIIEFVSQNR